jgi:hypothetical protein
MLQEPRSENPAPAKAIPWKRLIHVAWILGLAIAGGVAYSVRIAGSSSHPTHAASTDPKILARVGDALITESDLLAAWAKKPPFSNTDASQHTAVVLEDLIRRELYFAEATRTRFTEREDVRAAWKRWVTSRFREELESALPASQSVEDAAIEAYFQDHAAQFTAPERRRLAIIRSDPHPFQERESRKNWNRASLACASWRCRKPQRRGISGTWLPSIRPTWPRAGTAVMWGG